MDNKSHIEDVRYVMSLLKLELRSKLEQQGHGKRQKSSLIQSIDFDIQASANIIVASMYMNDYYVFVEKGVKASRIPYSPGRRSGKKTSKYIQGLVRFWRFKRGLQPKAALRAAFATANKHKKEGMPTRSSFRYSHDGTRLGFVDSTLSSYADKVFEILQRRTGNTVELTLTNILNDFAYKVQ